MTRRFFDYWRAKCRDGRLPSRQDIDPLDMPELLPHIAMYDVVRADGDVRFRIRLFGTANVQLTGGDCTGQFLEDQLNPEDAARIIGFYRLVADEGRPHFWRSFLVTPGREHVRYERLLLPLASDGKTVDILVALFVPLEAEPERG